MQFVRRLGLVVAFMLVGCGGCPTNSSDRIPEPTSNNEDAYTIQRKALVRMLAREITDQRVLDAMSEVPRHMFVPSSLKSQAYINRPLPIGEQQTISQPFIVAYMTQALMLTGREKVLEIGTGSGYQAAVLAKTARQVYSVEIIPSLARRAKVQLAELGYKNVEIRVGDGFDGWPEHAPFDAVMVTASPERVPPPLVDQLKEGGRLSIPLSLGKWNQSLKTFVKKKGQLVELDSLPVAFVPMTGKAEKIR